MLIAVRVTAVRDAMLTALIGALCGGVALAIFTSGILVTDYIGCVASNMFGVWSGRNT